MSNKGKKVKVHYVGTLDDGTKFDSSRDRGEPLEFICMAGQMIPGFDMVVCDMSVGETATARLEPNLAYGPHRPELMHKFPVAQMPEADSIEVGMKIMLQNTQDQRIMPATVTAIDDQFITLDLNHELAGKVLNFEIELLEVEDA
ncbi:MAG: peptidylprolyl isomerase [Coriobacteriales bacterium]|nr:peptidylprolyl isomerase [Coriobacteriales bacterium]